MGYLDFYKDFLNLEKVGKEWKARCPFHPDSRPSLSVNPITGRWRCFGCGRAGHVIEFIKEFNRTDTKGAIKFLREYYFDYLPNHLKSFKKPEYIYRDEKGDPIFKVVKYIDKETGERHFPVYIYLRKEKNG